MPGYYLPDLDSVGVNEENGLLINPSGDLILGYNQEKFPGFFERGYAVSNFMVRCACSNAIWHDVFLK